MITGISTLIPLSEIFKMFASIAWPSLAIITAFPLWGRLGTSRLLRLKIVIAPHF
jgi:hypothetical protein